MAGRRWWGWGGGEGGGGGGDTQRFRLHLPVLWLPMIKTLNMSCCIHCFSFIHIMAACECHILAVNFSYVFKSKTICPSLSPLQEVTRRWQHTLLFKASPTWFYRQNKLTLFSLGGNTFADPLTVVVRLVGQLLAFTSRQHIWLPLGKQGPNTVQYIELTVEPE